MGHLPHFLHLISLIAQKVSFCSRDDALIILSFSVMRYPSRRFRESSSEACYDKNVMPL